MTLLLLPAMVALACPPAPACPARSDPPAGEEPLDRATTAPVTPAPATPTALDAPGTRAPSWIETLRFNVYVNGVGRRDTREMTNEEGDPISDRLRARKVDLDLRAPLTPHVDGVVIASLEGDPASEFEAGLEEGYFHLLNVPALEPTAWGLSLKGGRFRTSFGRANRLRLFEIPQPTRPLALMHFLGEDGLVQTGLSAELRLPDPTPAQTLSLTLEGVNSGDLPISGTVEDEAYAWLGNVDWSWMPAHGKRVRAGLSAYQGKTSRNPKLFGADALFSSAPADGQGPGGFQLGGEVFLADIERGGGVTDKPMGYYAWTQVQALPRWFVGLRLDSVEDLADESLETHQVGGYVTWAVAPNLRFSVGWQQIESDLPEIDGAKTAIFEANFGFGSNPLRPFWLPER